MNRIVITLVDGPDYALAYVRIGHVLVTQARGRNAACALADAVAKFRTARTLRRMDAADLAAMAAVG